MKIGLVLDDSLDKDDGVQQYVLTLGKWLTAKKHEVHYLVGETVRNDIPNIHSLSTNVRVRFNHNRMSIPWRTKSDEIRRVLSKEHFDILHVQVPYNPLLAGKIIKNAPKSTVVVGTFHILPFSRLESYASHFLAFALRKTNKRFDEVISVSEPARIFAKNTYKFDSTIIPNAVDYERFKKGKKIKKYSSKGQTVVFLGRLVERKGCMQLLKAVNRLYQRGLLGDVRVIVAGSGPLKSKLKNYVAIHQLGDVVKLVGHISENDKPDLFAGADIAVFPSISGESFGIVLIEAMAAGAAVVIAGDNPGYRSVMSDRNQQLTNPHNIDGLAKIIEKYLKDPKEREFANTWQQTRVFDFDIDLVGRKITHVYMNALRKRKKMR